MTWSPKFELRFISSLIEWPCHSEQEGWSHQSEHSVGWGSDLARGQDGFHHPKWSPPWVTPNLFCFKTASFKYVCVLALSHERYWPQSCIILHLYLHSAIQEQHSPSYSEVYPKAEEKREMNSSVMLKIISITKIPCNRSKQWSQDIRTVTAFLITMK